MIADSPCCWLWQWFRTCGILQNDTDSQVENVVRKLFTTADWSKEAPLSVWPLINCYSDYSSEFIKRSTGLNIPENFYTCITPKSHPILSCHTGCVYPIKQRQLVIHKVQKFSESRAQRMKLTHFYCGTVQNVVCNGKTESEGIAQNLQTRVPTSLAFYN
jgi:hypothetical protein